MCHSQTAKLPPIFSRGMGGTFFRALVYRDPHLPGKAIMPIFFSFTQNSVSTFVFRTGGQRPSFSISLIASEPESGLGYNGVVIFWKRTFTSDILKGPVNKKTYSKGEEQWLQFLTRVVEVPRTVVHLRCKKVYHFTSKCTFNIYRIDLIN